MSDRVFRLMERHRRLDDLLRLAQARRIPDPFEVMRLKRLKLAVKDRLARLLRKRSVATAGTN
ncbi:MAG: YdcH family protein [Erythrobacter sp.]